MTFSTASAACSLLDRVVIIGAAGTCTIDANQAADDDYEPAAEMSQSFEVLGDPPAMDPSPNGATGPTDDLNSVGNSETGCRCNNGSPDASSFMLLAFVNPIHRRR